MDLKVSSPMEALQELDFGAGWIATNHEPVIRRIDRCDWDTDRRSSLGFNVRYQEKKNATHTNQGNLVAGNARDRFRVKPVALDSRYFFQS